MRIRKVEVTWPSGSANLDFRKKGGHPFPVVGIYGANGSGKSIAAEVVIKLFRSSVSQYNTFLDYDTVSGSVEFDLGSSIGTGVMRDGIIVQSLVYSGMKVEGKKITGGFLMYNNNSRFCMKQSSVIECCGERVVNPVLSDLYNGDIRDSVIWVDSFDIGLDISCAREFLQLLIRKSLERDNQLIVSSCNRDSLLSLGENSLSLGGGKNVVQSFLNRKG